MRSDLGLRVAASITAAILVVLALFAARAIFTPLAFALLIIAIVWPMQRLLQRIVPTLVALGVTMLVTIAVITAFGSLATWAFSRIGLFVVNDAARYRELYEQLVEWLDGHGIYLAGLWAEHFDVSWLIRLFQEVTARVNNTLSFWAVVLVYVILGLLEVDDVTARLHRLGSAAAGRVLLVGGAATAAKFRRYMLVRTLMSGMTGLLVAVFALATGLGLPVEWGVLAFVLNYIPFIGSLVSTVLPTMFAVARFSSWEMVVVVFICLGLIQFLVGSYLEPRIAGRALSLSPFAVLFTVFFWTFLWGIAGALIGVPIVIAAVTLCAEHPASRWIADLLGGEGAA
jgi:predicted PurR-regulated permease PerM